MRQMEWLTNASQDYDVVIIAGDLLDITAYLSPREQIESVKPMLQSIAQNCDCIVCSGNHDFIKQDDAQEHSSSWLKEIESFGITTDGHQLLKDRYLFSVCSWWNTASERDHIIQKLQQAERKHADHWLWIHHAPPKGSSTAWTRKGNAGDPNLMKLIGKYQPSLVFSGHIHEAPFYADGHWNDRLGETVSLNAGQEPGNRPTHIVIDTDEASATYISSQGIESITLHTE